MAADLFAETKSIHVPAAYGALPKGWAWSRLDDVCTGVFDCPHSTPKLVDAGPFVVRTQDIVTGVFRADQAGRVSEETYTERIARVTPSHGDLLYSREGTYFGIAAEVPEKMRVCLGQRMVLIRPNARELDFRFLRHWLNSPIMAAHIHGYRDGSVAERLNLPTIRALPILIPPLSEQKIIASVLGALDDKIELNRRMNATLESMARALFQSWFVDFDPVRAKLDGRQPEGMDAETATLFPDSFQDSHLGPIPHGWEVDTIKNRASNIQYGFTQSATFEPIGPHFLRITDLRGGTIDWGSVPYCEATDEEREKYRVMDGDIFIARTGASTGDNIYVVEPPPTVFASYLIRVQFASRGIGRLVGEFTRTADYANHVAGTIGGSAQPNASAQALAAASLVYPSEEIANAFYRIVRPLDLRRAANDRESRTLATLRDTLLPKLLSGELSVAEIQGSRGGAENAETNT